MRSSPQIEAAFFDLGGASAYLGGAWGVRTLRRLIGIGELPFYRRGKGKIMIKRADLGRFLAQHRQEAVDLDALAAEAIEELRGAAGEKYPPTQ